MLEAYSYDNPNKDTRLAIATQSKAPAIFSNILLKTNWIRWQRIARSRPMVPTIRPLSRTRIGQYLQCPSTPSIRCPFIFNISISYFINWIFSHFLLARLHGTYPFGTLLEPSFALEPNHSHEINYLLRIAPNVHYDCFIFVPSNAIFYPQLPTLT